MKMSPKTGVRAYARTPVFGNPLNFREVLIIIGKAHAQGTRI
jgi:hypothetical protein